MRCVLILFSLATALPIVVMAQKVDTAGFDANVKPVITKNCAPCHNDATASGGVNLDAYTSAATVTTQREGWEKIVQKLQSGEMPPKGMPRPDEAKINAFVRFFREEFQKADLNTKADPGRVTARRLNRSEYTNTIRDLLGVDFRANQDFPTDDSGEGFDNVADVLSVSPLLMEKYVNAAERISARAIGTEGLPKPIKFTYEANAKNIRRIDVHTAEAEHSIDFDGDYDIVIGMPGERGKTGKPVKLGLWMDGKLIHSEMVETKPSDLVYFSAFSDAQMRLFLPQGDHAFRIGFIDDGFTDSLAEKDYYNAKKNKYPASITFMGPYATKVESESRKKIFVCDAKTGAECVQKIVATLAHRAYREPVTSSEVAGLMRFVALAKEHGEDVDHGIQLALEAILVSPRFLFRIERDPDPTTVHRVSDVELASRLSYFLWSSMPDDQLLAVAESGKLHEPAVLNGEVKRMLADSRSGALADNFAGQWLEIRNLDSVKPDPDRYMIWGPELRNAMKTETRMFFEYILRQNRPLSEFIDAKYTFLNDRLAKFYNIGGVTGPEFRKVDLATDQRGGILTQASVLTVSSYPTRTSPTIRGKYILNNILGTPPPPPPADVPALDASKVGSEVSLRKQLEEHRSNAVCASCHSKMDVLGFGLDNYNGIGKWRTMDGKFPIEAGGTLPGGKTFTTPAQMREVLLTDMPQFSRCVTEKMMIYALGRGLQPYDRRTVNEIVTKLAEKNYPFQSLVYETVHSLPFQSRRGEAVTTELQVKPKEIARK